MSHEHGTTLLSFIGGSALALAADAVQWIQASAWMGDVLHTLVFGALGGITGILSKRLFEHIEHTIKNRKTKN